MRAETPVIPGLVERKLVHLKLNDISQLYNVFEFQEEIGRGTFGIVVAAVEKKSLENWAIKIVNKSLVGLKLTLLNREITILKHVNHPNIIHLNSIYETAKKIYLVFERCWGELFEIYKKKKPVPEKDAKKIIKQIINAIAYLHKRGIIHRDIKMENILIKNNPNSNDEIIIKLTDFGLSIVKSGTLIENSKEFCGTITYMAPEVFIKEKYTELCDVWATGIIFYMLLFGYYPFFTKLLKPDPDNDTIINAICNVDPPMTGKKISNEAKNFIELMLNKDPIKRITSLQLLEHPYIAEKPYTRKSMQDENILNTMRKWKNEMLVAGRQSDMFPEDDQLSRTFPIEERDKAKP